MFSSVSNISEGDDLEFDKIQKRSKVKLDESVNPFLASSISEKNIPIIYRSKHNIGFFKLEELHPFDSKKFEKIAKFLVEDKVVEKQSYFIKAKKVDDTTLLKLHTKEYLEKMGTSEGVADIIEFPLAGNVPFFLINSIIVKPMKYQVGGTILAGEMALKYGWSINLGGGMHHCSYDRGGGWCAFGDIQLSIMNLRENKKIKNVMIVDLDAHQGNGHERYDYLKKTYFTKFQNRDAISNFIGEDDQIFIVDFYRHGIYPGDYQAQRRIDIDVDIDVYERDKGYNEKLLKAMTQAFERFEPDIVYYNAGTDILEGDPLGGLHISNAGVIQRDEIVFEVVMVTSGGYQKTNARVIADSIINLDNKLKILDMAKRNYKLSFEEFDGKKKRKKKNFQAIVKEDEGNEKLILDMPTKIEENEIKLGVEESPTLEIKNENEKDGEGSDEDDEEALIEIVIRDNKD